MEKEIRDTKGALKNKFTFWHLMFRLSLNDLQSQNPQNSSAIPAALINQITQI